MMSSESQSLRYRRKLIRKLNDKKMMNFAIFASIFLLQNISLINVSAYPASDRKKEYFLTFTETRLSLALIFLTSAIFVFDIRSNNRAHYSLECPGCFNIIKKFIFILVQYLKWYSKNVYVCRTYMYTSYRFIKMIIFQSFVCSAIKM